MAISLIKYKDREEWLALRRQLGIGGSEAATVAGLNPFSSPLTLYMQKTGALPENESSEALWLGTVLEEHIAKRFEEETGKKVRRNNAIIVNDQYPFAFADVDREIVGEDALLECKSTSPYNKKKYDENDFENANYFCQCMHYLMVTGKKRCYLAVLVLGVSFNIYTIERNEDEISALATLERDFVENHLNTGVPPLPEGSQSDADTIGFLQNDADIKPETVDLSKEKDLLASYKEICASIKQLEQQKEKISQRLMMQLGENLFGACDGFRVSYKPQTRRTFDAEKFKQHFPGTDLNQFYKVSQSRILKITAEKKKEA